MSINEMIEQAMARAFFSSAYANQYDEAIEPGFSMAGRDFMDVLPAEIDPAALHAARTLKFDALRANQCASLVALYLNAHDALVMPAGDRALNPDMFGHYLAMQAMGHGVGLLDAFGEAVHAAVKVPYVEFSGASLERDYFPGDQCAPT